MLVDSGSAIGENTLVPDLSTFQAIPWCPSHARVLAFSHSPSDDNDAEQPLLNLLDARTWLSTVCKKLKEDFGLAVKAGVEEEFYVLGGSDASGWAPVDNSTYAVMMMDS